VKKLGNEGGALKDYDVKYYSRKEREPEGTI
jgi:hypothetical protein